MPGLSRRRFLGATAGATVGAAAAAGISRTVAAASPATSAPRTDLRRRVVVIGSGFGGAVTALRLTQAGIPVLLLERGIRWPTGPNAETFTRMFSPDQRSAWLRTSPVLTGAPPAVFAPFTGILDRIDGDGVDILCGAGYGGSSLVYHGMTLEPTEAVFAQVLPQLSWGELHRTYYPRVARMLRLATIPDDVLGNSRYLSNQVFVDKIRAAGLSPSRIPMPIDWNYARAELTGAVKPSYTTGDVIYGVNNGGKQSLDVTYLAAAEATGLLEVATQHVVNGVALNAQGKWVVSADRINTGGTTLEQKVITADALFMGAGVAGTNRLLMRAKAHGTIPNLPDGLGTQVGTNGDRIYSWSDPSVNTGAFQGGPACVGVKDWANPSTALTIVHGPIPIPVEAHLMSVIGYGVTPVRGAFHYDTAKDDAVLNYPHNAETELNLAIKNKISQIFPSGTLTDTTDVDATTFHPLGGAPLGSVCDQYGRVRGHRGLYVMDGALIPGNTAACNPSMTIAALAERNLDTIVRTDVGTVF
ncbi:GMC oxidoreductase [Actinophytocola sp.]|uniref:GMC oxidoreductase n=1 Tax=Actinophytocola sp. TaxID=1872138 RepID=UPI002EDB1ABF